MTIKDPDAQMEAELTALEAKGIDPYAERESEDATDDVENNAQTDEVTEPAKEATQDTPVDQANPGEAEREDQTAYKAQMPQDYKAQRAELSKAKANAMAQLMDGEIDSAEFAKLDAGISDQLEDLTALRIRAETLHEANSQNEMARQGREIQLLIARTKAEVDYSTDPQAARQFDNAMQMIRSEPDNANMPFGDLLNLSHKMVASLRGIMITKSPVVLATSKPAPNRTPDAPPVTLSGLPTAATSGAQSVSQAVGKLSGDDLERAFDSMSEVELKKLMQG